jgi:glycosyltransferase involved in cell wall biosynthesis
MNEPLVSVVVSSFNRPAMLRIALLSLIDQTYKNIQIIVQDDSTNEDCLRVIQALADPRICYTRNEPPLGTVSNLRAGYRKCVGKYFCTLNDDDAYHKDYVATLVTPLEENPDYSIAFSDHYIIAADGSVDEIATTRNSIAFGRDKLKEGEVPDPLIVGMLNQSVPGMFAIFRTSIMDLNDFPDEVSSGYDYWLTFLALRTGKPIYYSPRRMVYYRVHPGSQTSSYSEPRESLRSLTYSEFMHKRFLADPRLKSIHSTLTLRLALIYASGGANFLRTRNRKRAFQQFVNSCKTKLTGKGILGLLLCFAPASLLNKALRKAK